MYIFISDRSKIEPTLGKSILYEEVATKLYFRLVGGNKSIIYYHTGCRLYYISAVHGLMSTVSHQRKLWHDRKHIYLILTQENGFSETDFKVYSRHDRRKESFKPF